MSLFKFKKRLGKTHRYKTRYRSSLKTQTRKSVSPKRQKLLLEKPHHPQWGPKFKRLFSLILTGIFSIALFYFLFLSSFFVIQTTKIVYSEEPEEKLSQEIQTFTDNLRHHNLILLSTTKLKQDILSQYPKISQAKIKKIFPRKIQIEINPVPIVANLIHKTNGFEKKYLLNQTGLITQKNIENPNLPYIILTSNQKLKLETIFIPKEKLNFILTAIDKFTTLFNLNIFDAQYFPIEREIHLRTEKYFYVWLDINQDIDKQLNKLKRALPSLDIYNLPLEYIDLRITSLNGQKIIYKKR